MNVIKKQKGAALEVEISGPIEETFDFIKIIGPPPEEIRVNCRGVSRINSAGVKAWINYFQACRDHGTKITFLECSVAVVEQLNLISTFACGGKVESIFLPFFCSQCKKQLMKLFKTESLKRSKLRIPNITCPDCSSPISFDDEKEEYFCFLEKNSANRGID